VAVGGITARLGLIPVLMLAIAWLLPIDQTLRNVIVVQAAMPCGLFPIMLAKHYGADTEVAARVVVLTTLTGLITIPLWLKAGYAWIGP
jgi:predicted permease